MKKALIVVAMFFILTGCAGLNVNTAANVATDIAFTQVLLNNPGYKAPVTKGLQEVKTFLQGMVTYTDLITQISKSFGGKYAYIGIVIIGYLDTDKPIFETNLTLFDAYKAGVVKKIDRLLLLASI
jgi:hypothetical protein